MHKTYTQSFIGYNRPTWSNKWNNYGLSKRKAHVPSYEPKEFDWSQSTFDFDNDLKVDTFREDEILREEDLYDRKPFCVNCYSDLEHDGFSNYHCSGCDSWFTENEVLTDSI
mgnify:CR=1 FL=1